MKQGKARLCIHLQSVCLAKRLGQHFEDGGLNLAMGGRSSPALCSCVAETRGGLMK